MSNDQTKARRDITMAVMNIMDSWDLGSSDMAKVMSLPENVRARAFVKFREGREAFPDDEAVMRRAKYILRIEEALRTAYPCNPKMIARWVKQRHRRFGRRTPLTMILEGGEPGLIAVLAELDCTFSWDLTGSQPAAYNS